MSSVGILLITGMIILPSLTVAFMEGLKKLTKGLPEEQLLLLCITVTSKELKNGLQKPVVELPKKYFLSPEEEGFISEIRPEMNWLFGQINRRS